MPRFVTPPNLPEGFISRVFQVPEDKLWLGVFSEALAQTIYAHNYEQNNPANLSPDEAAEVALSVYTAWLEAGECGAGCVLPNGQKVWRRNPTNNRLEYLDGDVWAEPTGDDAIPPPATRPEVSDEAKKCQASANAEYVLHQMFLFALDQYENEVIPAVAAIDFMVSLATYLAPAFFPPLAGIAVIQEAAFTAFYLAMDVLTEDMWDTAFTNLIICLLHDHATVTGGAVYFDWPAISEAVWQRSFTGQTYILQSVQLAYIVSTIGEQGLNVAGGKTAVVDYACGCGSWSRVWTGDAMLNGTEWRQVQGNRSSNVLLQAGSWPSYYASIQATVSIPSNTTIVGMDTWHYSASGGGTVEMRVTNGPTPWVKMGGADAAPYTLNDHLWALESGGFASNAWHDHNLSKQGLGAPMTLGFTMRSGWSSAYIERIRVRGTGPNPFLTGVAG